MNPVEIATTVSIQDTFEGKDYIVTVIETIQKIKEGFKSDYISKLIAGEADSAIKSYKHHKSPLFGIGDEHDSKFWNGIIRQALIKKLLNKGIENYGLLSVTKTGEEFLKKPYSITFYKEHEFPEGEDEDDVKVIGNGSASADPALFSMLKDLRKKIAKAGNTTFCNFSGSILAGYGHTLPHINRGTAKYDWGGTRKSETLRKRVCGID